jgi:hypothetical protein
LLEQNHPALRLNDRGHSLDDVFSQSCGEGHCHDYLFSTSVGALIFSAKWNGVKVICTCSRLALVFSKSSKRACDIRRIKILLAKHETHMINAWGNHPQSLGMRPMVLSDNVE